MYHIVYLILTLYIIPFDLRNNIITCCQRFHKHPEVHWGALIVKGLFIRAYSKTVHLFPKHYVGYIESNELQFPQ